MYPDRQPRDLRLRHLLLAFASFCLLALAAPALAGNTGGGITPSGTLTLELDNNYNFYRFVHSDGTVQGIIDLGTLSKKDNCLVGLDSNGDGQPDSIDSLVSIPGSSVPWGIDTGKGPALGGRPSGGPKGTGCGQIDFGEVFQIGFPNFLVGGEVQLQIEAKQQAVGRLSFSLNGAALEGSERYVISGSIADADLPAEVLAAAQEGRVTRICPTPDCGNDSGAADDALWVMTGVPLHDLAQLEVLQTGAGTGVISLKSGGDFPPEDPDTEMCPPDVEGGCIRDNRSTWQTFNADGILDCFGAFTEGTNLAGRRLDNPGCFVIPFDAEFEGDLFTFLTNTGGQDVGFTFDVCFDPEAADGSEADTLLSFNDPVNEDTCLGDESCFEALLCVGDPTYECLLDDPSDDVCGTSGTCTFSGGTCTTDEDCGSSRAAPGFRTECDFGLGGPECGSGQTCELVDLAPPGEAYEPPSDWCDNNVDQNGKVPAGEFPDCDLNLDGANYGCWYGRTDVYDNAELVRVCQHIFVSDDFIGSRRKTK